MSIQVDQEQGRILLQALGKNGATRMRGFYPTGHPLKPSDPGKKSPFDFDTATQWQQQGRGVYFVVGNGGDTDASITSIPALFCEWDDRPVDWQITAWQELGLPEPSAQVLTGGKSVHNYWIFQTAITPDLWRDLQTRLLEYADADRTLKNPSRVMRLPGAWHLGPDGTPNGQSTIIHLSEQRYSPDNFDFILPSLETAQQQAAARTFNVPSALRPRDMAEIKAALDCIPAAVPNQKQYSFYRNLLWALICACQEAGGNADDALHLIQAHSPLFAEAEQVARSSFTSVNAGTFWYHAQKNGYKLSKQHDAPSPCTTNKTEDAATDLSWTALLDAILDAIRNYQEDEEMALKADLKTRFRASDDQINTALFKRYTASKIQPVAAKADAIDMGSVETLDALMDGWIPKGDVALTYGPYGTGKTTLAIAKARAYATGSNFLDYSTPCIPGRSLIIATDSGPAALKKSCEDLDIDPGSDPLFKLNGPDQMIWIWGHDAKQGHEAWICDIRGVIRLEQFIKDKGITYVAIDSAKSVSSAAGWSYTSNEAVKTLLKYLREAVCAPLGCCIEFLSHDGSEKGSHSGAKAWAEDPSMVCALSVETDPDGRQLGVKAHFRKNRTAAVDPRRTLTYTLTDHALVLAKGVEVVGNCSEAILTVLWDAYLNDVHQLKKKAISDEVFDRFKRAHKTVEHTLSSISGTGKGNNPTPLIRKGGGFYALAPHEIQRRLASTSSPNRGVGEMGGGLSKSLAAQEVCHTPYDTPIGGFSEKAKPPKTPIGGALGGDQIPVPICDLTQTPPVERTYIGEIASDDDPHWPPRPKPQDEEPLPF